MKTVANIFLKIIFIITFLAVSIFAAMAQDEPQALPQSAKKEIPRITFKNLSPPFTDYDYFQGYQEYPFQVKATAFSLINAWWLAEAATLVYADEEFVRDRFSNAGLPQVRFFDKHSTQCYVANNDQFAIVAFRGSEIWKKKEKFDLSKVMADLKADVDIRLTDWTQGGKVHRGFKEALEEVWIDLSAYIRQLDRKGCKIWMTGHSLGAALATLCANRYGNVLGVYTFGSPRVGNDDFRDQYDINLYRIVNNDDIVARVPPAGTYRHVGELKFINGEGTVGDHMIEKDYPGERRPNDAYGQAKTSSAKKNAFAGFVPAAFRDHVPLLYAVYLWNNIVEKQN